MQIVVELPEDIFERLEASWGDVSRGVLEAVAVEGHRAGSLTHDDVARLLGLSFWQTDAFLKERRAYSMYTEADFEQDRRDIDRVGGQ
jgi:hypothetical protein